MADLTVTMTEAGDISGSDISTSTTKTISGITNIYHTRFQTTTNSASSKAFILNDHTSVDAGNTVKSSQIKYVRITNIDDSATLKLLVNTNDHYLALPPNASFVAITDTYTKTAWLYNTSQDASIDETDIANLQFVQTYQGSTTPCWCELFIAANTTTG